MINPPVAAPPKLEDNSGYRTESVVNGPEQRAAYRLARNLHLIEGWLFTVRRLADTNEHLECVDFAKSLLPGTYDDPPNELIAEVSSALHVLAMTGCTDAATLVELRRALDYTADECDRLAELARYDLCQQIRNQHASFGHGITASLRLQQRILRGEFECLNVWRRLGERVGMLLADTGFHDDAWYGLTFDRIAEEAVSLNAIHFSRFRQLRPPSQLYCEESIRNFKRVIQHIDGELEQNLNGVPSHESYFVLDDQRRVLTYLGVELPYRDFSRMGLHILRVFIFKPRTMLSSTEILAEAGSSADGGQFTSYLSRVKRLLRGTRDRWPDVFRDSPRKEHAESAFIVADTRARGSSKNGDCYYMLDLPPYLVHHIPVASF